MRKLGAGILVLTLAGCASTRERRPSDQAAAAKEDCTRFEAAARAYGNVFNPIKWQKQAIEDCGSGGSLNFWDRTLACMAVPGIFPFATLVAVVGAPLLFPILLASDNIYRVCPQQPAHDPGGFGAGGSHAQPGETLPSEEDPAWPAGRR